MNPRLLLVGLLLGTIVFGAALGSYLFRHTNPQNNDQMLQALVSSPLIREYSLQVEGEVTQVKDAGVWLKQGEDKRFFYWAARQTSCQLSMFSPLGEEDREELAAYYLALQQSPETANPPFRYQIADDDSGQQVAYKIQTEIAQVSEVKAGDKLIARATYERDRWVLDGILLRREL